MAPKLYKMDMSPPARSVALAAAHMGIPLDFVEVNLSTGDHLKPDYVKHNPQHTIPSLEDDGKFIWDSHAILIYLFTKYGKDDSLYPKDPYQRAVVDQRLHFDTGVFALARQLTRSMLYKGLKRVPEDFIEDTHLNYGFLDKFLEERQWVAGDNMTLADFSLLSTFTTVDVLVPIDHHKYPHIATWLKKFQQQPYYSINQKGVDDYKQMVNAFCPNK